MSKFNKSIVIKDEGLFNAFQGATKALGYKMYGAVEEAMRDWMVKNKEELKRSGFTIKIETK